MQLNLTSMHDRDPDPVFRSGIRRTGTGLFKAEETWRRGKRAGFDYDFFVREQDVGGGIRLFKQGRVEKKVVHALRDPVLAARWRESCHEREFEKSHERRFVEGYDERLIQSVNMD